MLLWFLPPVLVPIVLLCSLFWLVSCPDGAFFELVYYVFIQALPPGKSELAARCDAPLLPEVKQGVYHFQEGSLETMTNSISFVSSLLLLSRVVTFRYYCLVEWLWIVFVLISIRGTNRFVIHTWSRSKSDSAVFNTRLPPEVERGLSLRWNVWPLCTGEQKQVQVGMPRALILIHQSLIRLSIFDIYPNVSPWRLRSVLLSNGEQSVFVFQGAKIGDYWAYMDSKTLLLFIAHVALQLRRNSPRRSEKEWGLSVFRGVLREFEDNSKSRFESQVHLNWDIRLAVFYAYRNVSTCGNQSVLLSRGGSMNLSSKVQSPHPLTVKFSFCLITP
jgi:hypothetical protein